MGNASVLPDLLQMRRELDLDGRTRDISLDEDQFWILFS